MKSKFSKAFDALGSDERTRRERTERILAEYEDGAAASQELPKSKYIAKRRGVSGRRATAIVTACVVLLAALASLLIVLTNSGGLLNALSLLKGTYVDMDGIAAFGVWSAPDSSSDEAYISDVAYINSSVAYAADEELPADSPEDGDGILSGEWSDEERYDWESDYDWDPSKANVLISINEDGSVSEVVYERTNGRGQVRQDSLGNAVKVYVSKNFTYVMYVSDDDWDFWRDINFAQETVSPQSFTCHHEMQQTIVIHNATGKVFALNDIVSQVNEYSGAVNHTLSAYPYKNDVLCVSPMYGNYIDQWYNVCFDEETQSVYYEPVLSQSDINDWGHNVQAVQKDIYGQYYVLAGRVFGNDVVGPGDADLAEYDSIANIPHYSYKIYGNSYVVDEQNAVFLGTDGRVYTFDGGILKVFGENFALTPVSPDTEVKLEGICDPFVTINYRAGGNKDGIIYTLSNGYMFSMFGEVWQIGHGGELFRREPLQGSFPKYAYDGYLIGGELIAFVNTERYLNASVNGDVVQISFEGYSQDTPSADSRYIISASEVSFWRERLIAEQNEAPYTSHRGSTKYYLVTVTNGEPRAEHIANGFNGGVTGLVKPVTEPLMF